MASNWLGAQDPQISEITSPHKRVEFRHRPKKKNTNTNTHTLPKYIPSDRHQEESDLAPPSSNDLNQLVTVLRIVEEMVQIRELPNPHFHYSAKPLPSSHFPFSFGRKFEGWSSRFQHFECLKSNFILFLPSFLPFGENWGPNPNFQ